MPISFSSAIGRASGARGAGVTAVLGPTNTGKTHLAIERMLGHSSGIIGLPLRLLAREVYNKVAERVGAEAVALVTGEEKIKPSNPRYWVSTVEAMPRELDVAFLAVDEVQLGADLDRGHVFTDRMLNRRGREETLVLGAQTVRPMVVTAWNVLFDVPWFGLAARTHRAPFHFSTKLSPPATPTAQTPPADPISRSLPRRCQG